MEAKNCPCCGKTINLSNEDTMHIQGGWFVHKKEPDLISYRTSSFIHDMKNMFPKKYGIDFGYCYVINCAESYGGCGLSISGNSKKDVLEKWNRRST